MEESSLFGGGGGDAPMKQPHEPYSQSILANEFMFQQTMAVH
jgi:phospholipase A-2-activating protein